MGKPRLLAQLAAFAFLAGCGPETTPSSGGEAASPLPDLEDAPDGDNTAQAVLPNSHTLNGIATNGVLLNGIATNGVEIAGVSAVGLSVNATIFTARSADSDTPLSGTDFLGATMSGLKPDGTLLKVRIDAMTPVPTPNNGDLYGYTVSFDGGGDVREYICGLTSSGQPVQAMPLMGTWNYGQGPGGGSFTPSSAQFTFACRGMAIGKCVELGYRPWKAAPGGGTMQNHLTACTRALRADYCGTGHPYTLNGMIINLYDNVGVQADTASWPIEAEWTPTGARFLTTSTKKRYKQLGGAPPPCAAQLETSTAGSATHFTSGTLLMTEFIGNDALGRLWRRALASKRGAITPLGVSKQRPLRRLALPSPRPPIKVAPTRHDQD